MDELFTSIQQDLAGLAGRLLRGEGAPAPVQSPVVLPEEPSNGPALYELNRTRDRGCFLAGWLAARAEVARHQGGHDHE